MSKNYNITNEVISNWLFTDTSLYKIRWLDQKKVSQCPEILFGMFVDRHSDWLCYRYVHLFNAVRKASSSSTWGHRSMLVSSRLLSDIFVKWVNNLCNLFSRKFDHFGCYSLVFVPSVLGGCLLNFGTDRVQQLFRTALFQCVSIW